MSRLLVVEDSEEYQRIVKRTLSHHDVHCVATADEVWPVLEQDDVELILLDIHLPRRDGFSLLEELQSNDKTRDIPVMFLTGKSSITDKVTAFSLGAVDYIVKPFDPIELRARVDAKLTRGRRKKTAEEKITVGPLEIDQSRHRVWIHGGTAPKEVHLTQTEFKLLCCLGRRPEQVFTRDHLLVSVWGEDAKVLDRVVDVHICSLRKKIGGARLIQSVSGIGYKLRLEQGVRKAR